MITTRDLADLCARVLGAKMTGLSTPGGPGRASIRVHLADRTVIATYRPDPERFRTEAMALDRLSKAGAPVPFLIAQADGIIFQQDVGSKRLSTELDRLGGTEREAMARRAVNSLKELKAAANDDLVTMLPKIALNPESIDRFVNGPRDLSLEIKAQPPILNLAGLKKSICADCGQFVKWDARPGNAAVQPDGSIVWFDWEHCGLRQGAEDFGFLFGDEFWPLSAQQSLELLVSPIDVDHAFLVRFTALHIVQRLILIHAKAGANGWEDRNRALQLDLVGNTPCAVARLCAHGAEWASLDPMTVPLVQWFGKVQAKWNLTDC